MELARAACPDEPSEPSRVRDTHTDLPPHETALSSAGVGDAGRDGDGCGSDVDEGSIPPPRRTPHGASRLVRAMSAWSVKTRHAPSQHCRMRGSIAYGHTTTAMHGHRIPPPPSPGAWGEISRGVYMVRHSRGTFMLCPMVPLEVTTPGKK